MNEIPKEIEELTDSIGGGWWNYRLIEKEERWTDKETGKEYYEKCFNLHEVYYNKNGEIISWSETPEIVNFQYYKELKHFCKSLKCAAKKPILKIIKDRENEELVSTMKYLKDVDEDYLSNWYKENY